MAQPSTITAWTDSLVKLWFLPSEYPLLVRYISTLFLAIGIFFISPLIILISLDIIVYIWRHAKNTTTPVSHAALSSKGKLDSTTPHR